MKQKSCPCPICLKCCCEQIGEDKNNCVNYEEFGECENKHEEKKMNPFVTGTQAYGPLTDGSDIDIVIHVDYAPEFEKYLHSHGIETYRTEQQLAGDYPGFYFEFFIIKINIIVTNIEGMLWWKSHTENMRKHHLNIADRKERIRLFNEEVKSAREHNVQSATAGKH